MAVGRVAMSTAEPVEPIEAAPPDVASWGWHLLQVSAWLLAVMIPIHLWSTWLAHDAGHYGVALYVDRWRSTPWRIFDWALIVLSLVHGGIGLNGMIASRVDSPRRRTLVAVTIGAALGALGLAVSVTIFSFDVVG
jgi:succinate dehydrogenase hydrophobic anchor subunit